MNKVGEDRGRRASMEWESPKSQSGHTQPIPIRKSNLPTPNLVLLTVDGYTVSHSLLVDNMPTDSYGFLLDERHGQTMRAARDFEQHYATKVERQVQRWNTIVPLAREGLVVFPSANERIKTALRKGLPRELRSKAWFYYSGAQARQDAEPKRYMELIRLAQVNANSPLLNQIESDVSHTFANNRRFRSLKMTSPFGGDTSDESGSHSALKRVLLAIAYAFPSVSYTNGLNCVAAALLLVTESEKRSFWILYSILDALLPENFYCDMNLGCNVDQDVLTALIAWKLPAVHRKLQELDMSLHIVTSSWFTHLFVDQLPFETLLRVWDSFLLEGSKILFRMALALFKLNQDELLKVSDPFDLAAFIRNMPRKQLNVIALMETAFNGIGGFSRSWLEDERRRAIPFWKAKHAVRRFSRVSPAYCQAPMRSETPKPSYFAPVIVANEQKIEETKPALRLALEDTMPAFERPEELTSCSSSKTVSSTLLDTV